MKIPEMLIALIATVPFSGTAQAHHSLSMFDMESKMTVQGTVKDFMWMNPHCFIQLLVQTGSGTEEWSVETHSTTAMYRAGLRPDSLKSDDVIIVDLYPVKKGTLGGLAVVIRDSSGKPLHKVAENTPPREKSE